MTEQDISRYQDIFITTATDVGLKILAAIAFWMIGRWLIGMVLGMIRASLEKQKVDPTVLRYVGSVVTVTLNVLLVVGILGYFGIQTTTFAALIAAAGVAIGMAWSGLLANFAAGAFIIVLRPLKVGDFVTVAGVTGTVTELGLFTTTLNTPDNVQTIVGNNKVFGDTIQNFSVNPFRRVDLKCSFLAPLITRLQWLCCVKKLLRFQMCWLNQKSTSKFSISPWSARSWRCVHTATPTITGRCISIPTRRFANHWLKLVSLHRCRLRM